MNTQKCTNIDTIDEKKCGSTGGEFEDHLIMRWDQDRERSEQHHQRGKKESSCSNVYLTTQGSGSSVANAGEQVRGEQELHS